MAKYIRTKDGIVSAMQTVRTADVVKYGDTIEELCDEFVYHDKIGNTYDIDYSYRKHDMSNGEHSIVEIYGAIWTDKGLIYVANINKKGNLELL